MRREIWASHRSQLKPNPKEYGAIALDGQTPIILVHSKAAQLRSGVMKYVRDVLQKKGYDIWSVAPDTPVYKALQLMSEKNCGAVLVLDQETLVGILSERDYARKVILKGKSSKNTPVEEIMSQRVVCIQPDNTIDECMALMTDKRVRHLPVLKGEEALVGLISIGDVVKEVISEQEFIINQLESYIKGFPVTRLR
jgi:CBS domain-containing protein